MEKKKGELEYIVYTQNKKYKIKVISTIENNKFIVLEYKINNKTISKTISNVNKKVTSFAKSVKNNFVGEIGVGYGSGATFDVANKFKTGLTIYQDASVGVKGNKTYTILSGSASADVSNFGVSKDWTHEYPFKENESGFEHKVTDISVISNCPRTEKDFSLNAGPLSAGADGIFIGIQGDFHPIFGFHFKIGWDIK